MPDKLRSRWRSSGRRLRFEIEVDAEPGDHQRLAERLRAGAVLAMRPPLADGVERLGQVGEKIRRRFEFRE